MLRARLLLDITSFATRNRLRGWKTHRNLLLCGRCRCGSKAKRGRPKAAQLCTVCLYTVYLAYHKKHVHSRAVSDFIDFVKSYPGNDLPLSEGEE